MKLYRIAHSKTKMIIDDADSIREALRIKENLENSAKDDGMYFENMYVIFDSDWNIVVGQHC